MVLHEWQQATIYIQRLSSRNSAKNMEICMIGKKTNHQTCLRMTIMSPGNQITAYQMSHKGLSNTKLFLFPQLKQAEARLRETECDKRSIDYESYVNDWRNLDKTWWTEIQSHLEVNENILQKHLSS